MTWQVRLTPRRWQEVAFDKWRAERRGVVSVVTGGGKTMFALMCIADVARTAPDVRVLIVVPSLALLDQWAVSLSEELGASPEEIAFYSGEERAESSRRLNLLVLNTARELAAEMAGLGPTFLVIDECHRAGAPINARALRGTHFATLGLSATPVREYDEGFDQYIEPALGPIIFEYGYPDALRDGVITPFALHNVRVPLTTREQAQYGALSQKAAAAFRAMKSGTGSSDRVANLLRRRAAVAASAQARIPVAVHLVERHRGTRTIVFHERIEAADTIYETLSERGHNVTIYHSRVGAALRRSNLALYRRGVFDVLVTCRALDEGMNVPESRVAIIASGTASRRQRIQRLGRVLRPSEGKEDAVVYTVFATKQEEIRLGREAEGLEEVADVAWHEMRLG